MKPRRISMLAVVGVQVFAVSALAMSFFAGLPEPGPDNASVLSALTAPPVVPVERETPLRMEPLYDEPGIVSDEELAAVLWQIRPVQPRKELKPNHVEHALRCWGIDATFDDPQVRSGEELKDVLVNHGAFLKSWDNDTPPLLEERPNHGVTVRYDREPGGSVHHDHWLACLTEAGISLSEPVFLPGKREYTIEDVLQEALRDFRLDERETEWSSMAFGFWIAPVKKWTTADGRRLSFDLLAERLLRGHQRFGVCSGTHRVYSMMVLLRLDDEYGILSDSMRKRVYHHLENMRDRIIASQHPDGHWRSDWMEGAKALSDPVDAPEYRKIIATGHHLEWLAIAPRELHPPREQIEKAADWIIHTVTSDDRDMILSRFTFYSHVGNALAMWRGTRPAEFWRQYRKNHPYKKGETMPAFPAITLAEPDRKVPAEETTKSTEEPESEEPPAHD